MNKYTLEPEGWWNDDHDVYTWPIAVGDWGARIECHGSSPKEARDLAAEVWSALLAGQEKELAS